MYGDVLDPEDYVAMFYTSSQNKDESVAAWGIRLEEIFFKSQMEATGEKSKLCRKFMNVLKRDLKWSTYYLLNRITDFHELVFAVRRMEYLLMEEEKSNEEYSKNNDHICWRCGHVGHLRRNCPMKF